MSYRMLGGVDAGAAADQCHAAFDNGVRRGKCTAAVTTASDIATCVSNCDGSFDTQGRKDRCAAVCSSVWSAASSGGAFSNITSIASAIPTPVLLGAAGIVIYLLFIRKRS